MTGIDTKRTERILGKLETQMYRPLTEESVLTDQLRECRDILQDIRVRLARIEAHLGISEGES